MRLTQDVALVGGGNAGFGLSAPLDCHVYLLDGGDELALVDAGVGDVVGETGLSRGLGDDGQRWEEVGSDNPHRLWSAPGLHQKCGRADMVYGCGQCCWPTPRHGSIRVGSGGRAGERGSKIGRRPPGLPDSPDRQDDGAVRGEAEFGGGEGRRAQPKRPQRRGAGIAAGSTGSPRRAATAPSALAIGVGLGVRETLRHSRRSPDRTSTIS